MTLIDDDALEDSWLVWVVVPVGAVYDWYTTAPISVAARITATTTYLFLADCLLVSVDTLRLFLYSWT